MIDPPRPQALDPSVYLRLLTAAADPLPAGTLADRFHAHMTALLAALASERTQVGALFAETLRARAAGVVHPLPVAAALDVFARLSADAEDAPPAPLASAFAVLLSGAHFLLVLCWLYDVTPRRSGAAALLALMRDGLTLLRPMLVLPLAQRAVARLAAVVGGLFSDAPPAPPPA